MRFLRSLLVGGGISHLLPGGFVSLAGCGGKPAVGASNPLGESEETKAQRQATEESYKK